MAKKTRRSKRTPSKSVSYHHGDLKAALLSSAVRLLTKTTPRELSLRVLAREAGVSQAAPFRHFRSKEELIAAIAQQGFEMQSRYMREAMAAHGEDATALYYASGLAYFKMGLKHTQHFKLMMAGDVVPSDAYPGLQAAAHETYALLVAMIVRCQQAGLMGAGDPVHKALHCWSVVNGFTSLYAEGRLHWLGVNKDNSEQALKTLLAQYLNGTARPLSEADFGFSPVMRPLPPSL